MRQVLHQRCLRGLAALAVVWLAATFGASSIQAQYNLRWLNIGDFHHRYTGGIGQPEIYDPFPLMAWPGIRNVAPGGVSFMHVMGMWLSGYRDGELVGAHLGPRPGTEDEFIEQDIRLIGKFDAPKTTVDGLDTYKEITVIDQINESLAGVASPNAGPERMVAVTTNTTMGVTIIERALQFSSKYHDDYHISEYRFVNTGNTNADEVIEIPDQTLEDLYFTFIRRPKVAASSTSWDNTMGDGAWGAIAVTDILGNGENDYGVDWRGNFSWQLHARSITDRSTIGGPMWAPGSWWYTLQTDTTGRLGGAAMHGEFVLHADPAAHAPDESEVGGFSLADDPAQPRMMGYHNSDDADLAGLNRNAPAAMQLWRNWVEQGTRTRSITSQWANSPLRTVPSHAYVAIPSNTPVDGESFKTHFATTNQEGLIGSFSYGNAFGPYDLAPGQEVRIVLFDGVGGLSENLSEELGQWYRRQIRWLGLNRDAVGQMLFSWNPKTDVACEQGTPDCVSLTKDQWVMTARDSLFQLFSRAKAAFDAGYNVLEPPRPPTRFEVKSGSDKIIINWDAESDPPGGWEIYRAQNRYMGIPAPYDEEKYTRVAVLPGSARTYEDSEVARNVSYFYYMQAVGGANAVDPMGVTGTPGGVPLKSSRYYAQSYDPAFLKRAPGASLESVRVVPNPYNLGAIQDLRWPDQENKIAFLDIPGQSTIKIFTEIGELVRTIEHTDDTGDENWNLTTDSNQLVVTGIYLAVIRDNATGEQVIRKFVIIR